MTFHSKLSLVVSAEEKKSTEVQEAPETQEAHYYANHCSPAAEVSLMTV